MIKLDPNLREEAIEAGWLAYRERVAGFEEAYRLACETWRVIAVVESKSVIGALFVRDGVIHIGIVPEWRGRWASRRMIREMLSYGKKTTVGGDELECLSFVQRLGFKRVGHEFHI
jgi:GNAT superfamily N-acetyltransferase